MRHLIGLAAFASVLSLCACDDSELRIQPGEVPAELQAEMDRWLDRNGKLPVDYVVSLFGEHDVVFLGEQHRVRHELLLAQSLLEPLYHAGVRVLATEFGRREDQPLIDSLVRAPVWREELARLIIFNRFVDWGFREYVDVYRAAWAVNRDLGPDDPPFRVLGVNDSPDWSHVRKLEDRRDPEIMAKVWGDAGERLWARVVLEAAESGEQILVHCGIHHAFTRYHQPVIMDGELVRYEDRRMGNYLFRALGDRAATVFLHAPWAGSAGYDDQWIHPADGIIDALMLARSGGARPVGFDLRGSPVGSVEIRGGVYGRGYDLRLSDFADGWIFTKPISEFEGMTLIPDWINDSNIDRARLRTLDLAFREATIEDFHAQLASDADRTTEWRHLR